MDDGQLERKLAQRRVYLCKCGPFLSRERGNVDSRYRRITLWKNDEDVLMRNGKLK